MNRIEVPCAMRRIAAERLANELEIRFVGQRPQLLLRPLNRQRHREPVLELEHDDLLLRAEDRLPLSRGDPPYPMRAVHDQIANCELHPLRLAAGEADSGLFTPYAYTE